MEEDSQQSVCSPVLPSISSSLGYYHIDTRDQLLSDVYGAISHSNCVLIEGETGCGKTLMLRVLADMCGKHDKDMVVIHIGEQLDSKVLIGTFTCSGIPGEFVWIPGILTQSVLSGKWVFLEDIDQAPSDILTLLLPLVKDGKLVLPGYSNPVFAGKEFRLFATRRLSSHGVRQVNQNIAMLSLLENHMTKFSIPQYTLADMTKIISAQFPAIGSVFSLIINVNKTITLRKLSQLGLRLVDVCHNGKITNTDDFMLEILDILAGHLPNEDRVKVAMGLKNSCGGLSNEKIDYLCVQYKPVLQVAKTSLTIGRSFLHRAEEHNKYPFFAQTRSSLVLLEKVGRCVQLNEPVLLVGETGVGKTAAISYLATMTGNTLVTVNLSQQTDSTDLLGGFKPVQLSQLLRPLRQTFDELFSATFDLSKTNQFLSNIQAVITNKNWKKLLDVFIQSVKIAKKKAKGMKDLIERWNNFEEQVKKTRKQLDLPQASLAFQFVEGALVEAVRRGWWVLLDEVNLASPEALQCLNSLLEGPQGTFLLTEKLDSVPIKRHHDFRLFCCMNPATDVGKKSLPHNLRSRFTEFYVDDLKDPSDLRVLITRYLSECAVTPPIINGIIKFYNSVRELAQLKLQDGTGRRPHYSLRTLCRSLVFAAGNPCKNLMRSLYEGFLMSFLTQLKFDHHIVISTLIKQSLSMQNAIVSAPIPRPNESGIVEVEQFWLETGTEIPQVPTGYVITDSVKNNLKNLARIVFGKKLPILLQGPTSAGKTSLIRYLACLTGHKCLRVNNHEHTDLQEYVGMYTTGPDGQLVFQEGVLVEAMKNGYWIILDELNLAPTDVLEALNRVLDDNRELFIPETQQLVKAHPHFMLFGTQNPPGVYGGRKVLSRAFRNRFVELHFEDIPSNELVHILNQCSSLPTAYAKKMVAVMKNLQQRRSVSGVFEGKYGLITLRDLFRWAGRYRMSSVEEKFYDWEQHLAEDGFMLLSGRLRNEDEVLVIKEVIERQFKRSIDPKKLFGLSGNGGLTTNDSVDILKSKLPEEFEHIVWTPELMRMGVLIHRAIIFQEPVLLVGNTGCGKTSLCQVLMKLLNRDLYIVNCHMHTEAADFLGGLRPVRNRSEDIEDEDEREANDPLALFEWCDGVLVKGMREGGCVMLDEISLAEDAVLERLNSVLEPERKLLVAERGKHKEQVYELVAHEGFLLLATMNPGGDYGKKELSPALRNRFVEVWCHDINTTTGYRMIIEHNLKTNIKDMFPWSDHILEFLYRFRNIINSNRYSFTTRDIIMWITFVNKVTPPLSPSNAFYHGAQCMFMDGIGCGGCGLSDESEGKCEQILVDLTGDEDMTVIHNKEGVVIEHDYFGIHPFYIEKGPCVSKVDHYCLTAQGPCRNAFRILRAMQLGRPLMLEGEPGVGKTSIVTALAAAGGHSLTRINLSEHTDISDLFGSDLPCEGEGDQRMKFTWRDGPFLKALKNSEWILLDEMNLASQSVLEGLNACLDHRGEIFIPELNRTFRVPKGTRLFACQNPHRDGGGRKGLPRSFVNRFIQVYIQPMSHDDLVTITCSLYPELDKQMIHNMVVFNNKVLDLVRRHGETQGCGFNLRDILRWCELIRNGGGDYQQSVHIPGEWLNLLYLHRIPMVPLREQILSLYFELFEATPTVFPPGSNFFISEHKFQIGSTCLTRGLYRRGDRRNDSDWLIPCQVPLLEAMLQSVSMNWLTILVGDSCSGKSQLVKSLARLSGHKLLEYPMNSSTDTMELLGGFEQVNYSRHCCNFAGSLLDLAEYINTEYSLQYGHHEEEEDTRRILTELTESLIPHTTPETVSTNEIDKDILTNRIIEIKEIGMMLLEIANRIESNYINEVNILLGKLEELIPKMNNLTGGHFEWVDSLLVQAITKGHWMLLSHANFCSPSVLDRLNPLFEPNPILSIDERGVVNGHVLTITPHSNFRLFLTLDPINGEISRALRNRGVEIVILKQDIDDLQGSLVSSSSNASFPLINDLSLSPTVTMVTRDIQSLSKLLRNRYSQMITLTSIDIKDVLSVDCVLMSFITMVTMVDYKERDKALKTLANDNDWHWIIEGILGSGCGLLEDALFQDMIVTIRNMIQSILGTRYDGPVNIQRNERLFNIINNLPASECVPVMEALDSFQIYCTIKQLSLVNSLLKRNQSNRYLLNTLSKDVVNKLSIFIGNVLTSLLNSLHDGNMKSLDHYKRSRAFSVLTVLLYLCHIPCSISLFGVTWSMFKIHSWDVLYHCMKDTNNLVVQLNSLSDLDNLIPKETKVLNKLRELLGGPTPPTSMNTIQQLTSLAIADDNLVKSHPLAPPFHLLSQDAVQSRKELFQSLEGLPSSPPSVAMTDPSLLDRHHVPPAYPCVTQPAIYELKQTLYQGIEDITPSLIEYILHVPQWPTVSLPNGRGFLPLLELSHADPHLQSINSSLIGCRHSNTSSMTSLMNLCHASLAPVNKDTPLITLGDYDEKIRGLNCLHQFLWLQGFSAVQDSNQLALQGTRLLKCCVDVLLNGFHNAMDTDSLYDSPQDHLYSLLSSLVSDEYTGHKWLKIRDHIGSVCTAIYGNRDSESSDESLAIAKVHLGVGLCLVFAPTYQLDPLEIKKAEIEFFELMEQYVNDSIESCDSHMTHLASSTWSSLYPSSVVHKELLKEADYWSSLKEQCPNPGQGRLLPRKFSELASCSHDILNNLCNYNKLNSFIKTAANGGGGANHVIVWERSVLTAIHQLRDRFPTFHDLVQPFVASLSVLLDGVNCLMEYSSSTIDDSHECVSSLVQFPFVSSDDLNYGELNRVESILCYVDRLLQSGGKWSTLKRLLMVAVEVADVFLHSCLPMHSPERDRIISDVFELCYRVWRIADERRKEREEEEQSLYQYKTKAVDIGNETEDIEEELNKQFPNYEQELESVEETEESNNKEPSPREETDGHDMFEDNDVYKISQLHQHWLSSCIDSNTETESMLSHTMYSIGGQLRVPGYTPGLADIGGHIEACKGVLSIDTELPKQRLYNIYKDSYSTEVRRAQPVIKELVKRVQQVLEEWPDYPVLLQIMSACKYVLSLGVTDPLMKILAGLEMVLKKAQDWEAYSSSRLSLSKQLNSLSSLILEWRKMELSYWRNLFDISRSEMVKKSSHWWFHLYGLCSESMSTIDEDGLSSLIESLQQLMESSSVGEYTIKLNLLKTFSAHYTKESLECSRSSSSIGSVLNNIYWYYSQFSSAVENHLKDSAHPLEKEFKDHLSILRWNDGNYWAIKQASVKSHRTLVHFIKRYHGLLRQPVKPVLTSFINGKDSNKEQEDSTHLTRLIKDLSRHILNTQETASNDTVSMVINLSGGVSMSLSDCSKRMSILVNRFINNNTYTGLCVQLDEFIGQVVATYHELQRNDSIPSGDDKDKRNKAIKLLLMRRKRSLSDFIKKLKEYGLSHRKGEELSDDLQLLPFTQSFAMTTPLGNDCNQYFYSTVARMVAMVAVMGKPNKDLSLYHVKCIKGYSRLLLKYLCDERCVLSEELQAITELHKIVSRLELLLKSVVIHGLSTDDFYKWQDKLSTGLSHCLEAIDNTNTLLTKLPSSLDLSLTPAPSHLLPPLLSGTTPTSSSMERMKEWKKEISSFVENHLKNINNPIVFITKDELLILEKGFHILKTFCVEGVQQFLDTNLGNTQEITPGIFEYLVKLRLTYSQVTSCFEDWFNQNVSSPLSLSSCPSDTMATLQDDDNSSVAISRDMVKGVMLSVQRVVERERQTKQRVSIEDDEDSDIASIKDTYEATITNMKDMNFSTVNLQLKALLNYIAAAASPHNSISPLIEGVLPLLKVYQSLANRMADELQLCHRTIGKMTSVLMVIFTNLMTKGFCTPEDYSESNDNATEGGEFMDIEAGGFDEGEGSKNVNDKVDQNTIDPGGKEDDGGKNDKKEKKENGNEEDEDNAFEMEDDFEGDMEDVERGDGKDNDSESDDEDDEGVDKRMGEVSKEDTEEKDDELDRNLWAPEEEEEEDKDMNKESGGGTSLEEETQLVAKEESKRKRGDPKEDKEMGEQHPLDPPSDDEGVVNDIDEHFEAGRDTRQGKQEDNEERQDGDTDDFGEINMEDGEEDCEDGNDQQQQPEEGMEDEDECMDIDDHDQPLLSGDEEDDNNGMEEGDNGGEGHTQESEDVPDEDLEMESRSYCNNDTVYGVPQTQSTDANDQQKSNTEVKDGDQANEQEMSNDASNSNSGTVTSATEEDNGSIIPAPSKGRTRSGRKHAQNDHTPNPISDQRPIKRAKLMDSTNDQDTMSAKEDTTQSKDSTQYQHVSENQSSDNLAWDTVNNPEEGSGRNPLSEYPNNNSDDEGDEGDGVTSEQVPTSHDYKISQDDINTDKIINCNEETDGIDDQSTRDVKHEKAQEWVKPTDSFFANAQSSAWSSKSIDESTLRESLKNTVEALQQDHPTSLDSIQLWVQYELLTSSLSHDLCEELRLTLQPTQASKLKGDFRTGKRLNMRRIIPYIASNFQNDRIWLRRSQPSKREYQILLAVDDSSSMKENNCNQMAYESLAVITTALQKLECGQIGICRFGEGVELLHPLEAPFSPSQGGHLLHNLTFSQNRTNFVQLIKSAETLFSKCLLQGSKSSVDISQLLVVLSDGRGVYADGTQAVESGIRRLTEMGVFIVFIILDGLAKDSIVDIKVPIFIPGQPPVIKSYMETFPFPFYIVLRDIQRLPVVLGESLRQWFELVTSNST